MPTGLPLLSIVIWLPVAGALLLLLIGNKDGARDDVMRKLTFAISLMTLTAATMLWAGFNGSATADEFQFVERVPWIPAFGIEYYLGIDGISLMLIVLTSFLTPIALLSSWDGIQKKVKEFSIFMLLLEASMLGVFAALDLFLFYVFWDFVLIPMYFLIGVWGYDRRIYAAVKFILYTMAGSVLMLVAIIGLSWLHYGATGSYSFDTLRLYQLDIADETQYWFFLAFTLAFVIKVPLFPFHTWLPDAHVEAPTAGSVILAGVMLKMGAYGLIRFSFPLFPEAALYFAPMLAVLAVIAIVYGALVAMVQPDMKKLVAYSSVSHMGFVVLGIAAMNLQGVQGASYQMLAHGVSTGGLFCLVGMLSDRRHTRLISEYRWHQEDRSSFDRGVAAHHALVDWPTGHERLHRRVSDHARRVPVGSALRRRGGTRRDFVCGLYALDVPACVLRRGDQRTEPQHARPVDPRMGHCRSIGGNGDLHGGVPERVSQTNGASGKPHRPAGRATPTTTGAPHRTHRTSRTCRTQRTQRTLIC